MNINWNYSNQHYRLKQLLSFYSVILQLWQLPRSGTNITLASFECHHEMDLHNYDHQLFHFCCHRYLYLPVYYVHSTQCTKMVKAASYVVSPDCLRNWCAVVIASTLSQPTSSWHVQTALSDSYHTHCSPTDLVAITTHQQFNSLSHSEKQLFLSLAVYSEHPTPEDLLHCLIVYCCN